MAIQHYWPASSSAHIAGRRCRPFCIQIDINWPMGVSGRRCRPSTTATSAASTCGNVMVSPFIWQSGWTELWWPTPMSCSTRLKVSRMTKALNRESGSRMLNITDKNRLPRRRSRQPSISSNAMRMKF